MSVTVFDGHAIRIGYEYRLEIEVDYSVFPLGCELASQARRRVSDNAPLASLTTENGGLVRISDTILEIRIAASATAQMQVGSIFMDIVRTDVVPDLHLNISFELPVILPVTRGL